MALNDYKLIRKLQSVDGGLLALSSPTQILGANSSSAVNSVAIGFTFRFNGVDYTTISRIHSGGALCLNSTAMTNDNAQMEAANTFIIIAPWMDALITSSAPNGGGIYTEVQGSSPNRRLVIEWRCDASFSTAWTAYSERIKFQAVLYETSGKVEFRYNVPTTGIVPYGAPGSSASCGVKISTATSQPGNIRDFFGSSGTPAGSTGPFLTDRTIVGAGGAAIMWPGRSDNTSGLGAYNFHFQLGGPAPLRRRKPMKSQFLSTEALRLVFGAFRNETDGSLITGTDTCTVTYRKPDTTTDTVAATYDSTLQLWTASIPTGSYAQGEWLFKAASSNTAAHPQWFALQWGDYVETVAGNAATAATQAGAAATSAGTAATQATTAATQSTLARKAAINRLKVDVTARTQKLYDDDGTTVIKTWALTDENSNPTATRIFERGSPT